IDGGKYPMPELKDIIQEVKGNKEKFRIKFEQGLIEMQMTPIAMSLGEHVEKHKQVILKHHREGKLFATKKDPHDPNEQLESLELDENQPIWVWEKYQDADTNGELVYFPQEFSQNHRGKTKQQLIEETKNTPFPGWLVIFREKLPNIPRQGQGQEIKARKQLEAGLTPNQYLEILKTNPIYQNETGMTPEEQITYAIKHLEQTNQVIDDYSGKGSASYQLGAYFTADGNVPDASWDRGDRQAGLDRSDPELSNSGIGVRAGVRV
ncbi:hypothetical protein L6279_02300, partial [Candidatus Parcubacteria bacterium]|nr:hypothetical protein [Candidatus Parcubacteria bacterium]